MKFAWTHQHKEVSEIQKYRFWFKMMISVNANIELIDTVMALNTPPRPFLQQRESLSSNLPLFPIADEPSSRSVEATSTKLICTFQFSAMMYFWDPGSYSCTTALKIRLPKSGLKCLNLNYLFESFLYQSKLEILARQILFQLENQLKRPMWYCCHKDMVWQKRFHCCFA